MRQQRINRLIKKTFIALSLLICLGVFTTSLFAGGWVVISLDSLPGEIVAGEDVRITFWVRQHGQTPIHSVNPVVTGRNAESGQQIQVEATKEKTLGLYEATLNFPASGEWQWSISAQPFPQTSKQAPLRVLDQKPVPATSGAQPAAGGVQVALRAGGLALIGAAFVLAIQGYRRQRDAAVPVSGD
jgi:hypothetical protein